jgi:hypothetical protein
MTRDCSALQMRDHIQAGQGGGAPELSLGPQTLL